MSDRLRNLALWTIAIVLLLAVFSLIQPHSAPPQEVAFAQLLTDLDQNKVSEVVVRGQAIEATYADGHNVRSHAPNASILLQRLNDKGIAITARPLPGHAEWRDLAVSWVPFVALVGVWLLINWMNNRRRARQRDS